MLSITSGFSCTRSGATSTGHRSCMSARSPLAHELPTHSAASGSSYIRSGVSIDRARQLFERAITVDPNHAHALSNLANDLRAERRDLDRAQELYERSIAAAPKDAAVVNNFADFPVRRSARHRPSTRFVNEQAIATEPQHAGIFSNFARFLCAERRDLDRAHELHERAIAVDPKDVGVLNNFANFLRVEQRDLDRAQELY